jgi:adenosylhomocysteine nucleosidase
VSEPPRPRRVAVLAPMKPELRPFVKAAGLERDPTVTSGGSVYRGSVPGAEVVAVMTGIGMEAATRATTRALDLGPCDHVLVVGIAGGVDPNLRIGDVVVPEVVVDGGTDEEYAATRLGVREPHGRIVSSDVLLAGRDEQAALVAAGVSAVDMETAAIAAACLARGIPWSAFRGISDHGVEDGIDTSVLGLSRADGTADAGAVARYVLTRPWRVPTLARLGRDMQKAVDAAVRAALDALARP